MKSFKEIIENTFEKNQSIYKRILKDFYPSLGSTGFQERNLTVNFSKAYECVCKEDSVISWFELQFGDKKNNHFDCVIININRKEIFIVESKRFVSSAKKQSIMNDVERISSFVNSGLDERFNDYKNYSVYGVILADVWKENKAKEEIYRAFKEEDYFSQTPLNESWHMYDTRDIQVRGCEAEYSLLSFIWKIKD